MREDNKTIAKNTLFLYLRTFISIIVSLYTSRVLLEMLGIEDFGIFNLVGGIVALFAILRGFLVASIQRYLNVEIGKGNRKQEDKILNISITVNYALVIIFAILAETIGLWFVNTQLNIPEGEEYLAVIVYHLTVATTLLSMLSVPYNALIIAHERMSFFAWITIVEVTAKLGITLSLVLFVNRLMVYSSMLMGLYFIILIIYYYYCRKFLGMGRYRIYNFSSNSEYKEILSFSGWTIVGNGASIARDQGISILFNIYGGVALNAAMGVVHQISNIYSTLFSNIQTAFSPQIIQNCSTDQARFRVLIQYSCLSSFILISLVSLPLISNADYILHIWLGDIIPDYTIIFTQLFMVKILIVSISQAIYQSLVAAGYIKEIQLGFVTLSTLTLIISWLMLRNGLSPAFAIIAIILMDLIMLVLRICFMSKYTEVKVMDIVRILWNPFIVVFVVMIPLAFFFSTLPQNFLFFIICAGSLTILNLITTYFAIDKTIKKILFTKIKTYINKI